MNIAKGLVSRTIAAVAAGAPVGAAVIGTGNAYVCLVRFPKAVAEAYRALWRCEVLGPNLKTLVSVTAPAAVIMVPPTVAYGSTLFGAGYGIYLGFIDPLKVFGRSVEVVKKFDRKLVDELVKQVMDFDPKLREGERPFDIRIVEALTGLLCAAFLAPVETVSIAGVTFRRWLPLYAAVRARIWDRRNDIGDHNSFGMFLSRLTQSAVTDLATVGVVTLPPFVVIAAHTFSVGDMTVAGYRKGMRGALETIKRRATLLDQELDRKIRELRGEAAEPPEPNEVTWDSSVLDGAPTFVPEGYSDDPDTDTH